MFCDPAESMTLCMILSHGVYDPTHIRVVWELAAKRSKALASIRKLHRECQGAKAASCGKSEKELLMEELQRRHEEEQRRKQEEEKDDLDKVVAGFPCDLPCNADRTENDGTVCCASAARSCVVCLSQLRDRERQLAERENGHRLGALLDKMRRRPSADEADKAYSRHKFRYTASSLSLFGTSKRNMLQEDASAVAEQGRSGQMAIQTHSDASVGQQNVQMRTSNERTASGAERKHGLSLEEEQYLTAQFHKWNKAHGKIKSSGSSSPTGTEQATPQSKSQSTGACRQDVKQGLTIEELRDCMKACGVCRAITRVRYGIVILHKIAY